MIYLTILLIIILCFSIIGLIINYNISKEKFQRKIEQLEVIIVDLNKKLDTQNHHIKISDDLELKLNNAKTNLSNNILDINIHLLDNLYSRNNT